MTEDMLKQILEEIMDEKGEQSFDEFFSDVKYVVDEYRHYKILNQVELYLENKNMLHYESLNEDKLESLQENLDIHSKSGLLLEVS